MAVIAVVSLELRLEDSHSLKDKRQVIKSLKERLRHRFNVAVAEIEFHELWQRSVIAAVTVSADRQIVESTLSQVEQEAYNLVGTALVSATVEWVA